MSPSSSRLLHRVLDFERRTGVFDVSLTLFHPARTSRIESALPKIQENFTSVSPDPKNPKNASFPLIADGAEAYLSYASGRRGTLGMHSTISLVSRLSSPLVRVTARTHVPFFVALFHFFRSLDTIPSA